MLDDGTDEEYYEKFNQIILDGNMMNMSLIIMEGKYGTIYTDDSSCHGYYTIKFSSSLHTLQADFIIGGNVMNMSLIIMKGNSGDIDADDSSCHGYYIINFFLLHIPFNQT